MFRAIVTVFFGMCCIGCAVQEPTAARPGLDRAAEHRRGNVFLVRGLLGTFSTGMDELRDQLQANGVPATAMMHTADKSASQIIISRPGIRSVPLVIIGHSLGADSAILICHELNDAGVSVDLLVTLDPVDAPGVPPNVRRTVNYYRSNGIFDVLPVFRGTPLHVAEKPVPLTNLDLNDHPELVVPATNHFTIDTNYRVQQDILRRVLAICPPSHEIGAATAGSFTAPSQSRQAGIGVQTIRSAQ